jgi:predicted ATPase/signal transduction histidine kinase
MGRLFPGYRVLDRIYAGPRSVVERAVRVADDRLVVIKYASGDVVAGEAARSVHHEHGLLRLVAGDGVVEVCETLRDGGQVSLVLESFGDALSAWLTSIRFELTEILDLTIALSEVLARVHALGVVHKDVNPHNIVYDPERRAAKLIDFDIASRMRSASPEPAVAAALEGTLCYMAPEQTGRLNRSVDARSDLYSLGIVLHELIAGALPFEGDALALVHAHLARQPPRLDELDPRVPSVVADLVMKLLAKAPEQRYQTALGLRADLERCRRALADTGDIAPFALGEHDVASRFEFSERLYGRDGEIQTLVDAFERTASGGGELVLVSGYSGVGKSSFVREIYAPVARRAGYVAAGKFEQLHRDVPYSAVIAALDELLTQIVADPAFDRWRAALATAVAGDGPLVRTLLPAIERVLGAQPAPPVLDPEVAQRRLAIALCRLVQVFARTAHPLVLWFDDMQWSDAASLQLLTRLASSPDTESLLVIETYRDNEVDVLHPFAVDLRDHDKRGTTVSRIALAPLDPAATAELVGDALRVPAADAAAVAAAIWRKTEGNPFFIRQLMQVLHDDGHLRFDPATHRFALDVAVVERAAITENVADLLALQLRRLPDSTREVLVVAAAIGNRFDVTTLAVVAARPAAEIHAALVPAADAGMIVASAKLVCLAPDVVGCPRYAFHHDRIQQAVYEALPADARARLHLEIGRQLLASADATDRGARMFDIVHHLSLGLGLIADPAECARFAELALTAARQARRAGAFDIAASVLRTACGSRDPVVDYPAWFACHLELAEVLSLGGEPRAARTVIADASRHTAPRDLATLGALDTNICVSLGLMADAVACARRAAALLGVDLPADPGELDRQIELEVGTIMAAAAATPIAAWIALPAMHDPDKLAAMALLMSCVPAAYQIEPPLLALLCARAVTLSLRHGNCGASARAHTSFSFVMWVAGQPELGFQFGKLGIDLVRQLGARDVEPAVEFTFAAFSSPWRQPLVDSVARLRDLVPRAIEVGDVAHAGYATVFMAAYRMIHGAPLGELIDDAVRGRELCARLGLAELESWLRWYPAHARTWTGTPPPPGEPELDFAEVLRDLHRANGSRSVLAVFYCLELERRFWRGDTADALASARTILPMLVDLPGNVYNAEVRLYHCLSAIAAPGTDDRTDELAASQAALTAFADACPANFAATSALVAAERARVCGDVAEAVAQYDAAIAGAAEHGFLKIEILAHEHAAQFWLGRDKPEFAAVYLGKARDLCEHWGARPRAYHLERRRRSLGAPTSHYITVRSASAVASTLDFATIAKASHAIASDLVLDSLLVKIMEIIIENAGAQTGSIILDANGELRVHAAKDTGAAMSFPGGIALATARDSSEGIIRYVTRTAECVVLVDALRHPTFRSDPYVRARRPRSVLCLPIVHKERMLGAVYLENNLVAGAFTVERLEAIGVLLAQLAISIENAMMYSRLEDLVAERTRALTEANHQLREQALVRARMESELRLAQKLQAVGQLAAGVAHEINTPIQFVGNSIEFLQDGFTELLGIVDLYHGAVDLERGTVDTTALRAARDELDADYLRAHAPGAWSRARDGIARVTKIVCAMKAFAHPDQHEQTATNLNTTLENTLVVAQNEYRHIADIETDFAVLPDVICHAGEISQVFLNIVVNAAHAIEDRATDSERRGVIAISTRLETADTVLIAIRDTGDGIPDTIRDRVFDPFFTTKTVGRGSGQGLALARTAIVDRHGGTIDLVTELGVGTTFYVRLPVHGRASGAAVC